MSYASLLATKFGTSAIWLYEFTRDGTTTRLCAAPTDYTDGNSVVWTASPVTHTRFRITSSIGRAETMFVFPQSNTFARGYLTDLSYGDNTVTVYREFKNQSPEARVVKFRGRVIGTKPMFTRLTLLAENRFTEARRKALHPVMQHPCRHALYHTSQNGFGCRLSISAFQTAGTLSDLTGNVATVSGAASQANGYYSGGVLEWNGKFQLITAHTGDYLTLLGPLDGLAAALVSAGSAGVSVDIAPGCDRTRATCSTRFNNLDNHGGFPWMDETPFDGKTLY